MVVDHVMKVHEKLETKNEVKCFLGKGPSVPWVTDPKNDNFASAAKAIKTIRGVEPDLTREGCSIPGQINKTHFLNLISNLLNKHIFR